MQDLVTDRRAELVREIEYCNRQQQQLAERALDRSFTPDESRDWSRLRDRLAAARGELKKLGDG